MTKTNYYKLLSWRNKIIEDWGGCVSEDFKKFTKDYRNFLNRMCKNNGWELVNFYSGHYEFFCFIKNKDHYIYLSISDVRYFDGNWYKNILFRSAKHEKDYTGGSNRYTELSNLEFAIKSLFSRMTIADNL